MWLKQQFLPLQKPLQNRILYRSSPKILIGRMLEYKEFKVNLEVNSLSLKRQKLKKKKKKAQQGSKTKLGLQEKITDCRENSWSM